MRNFLSNLTAAGWLLLAATGAATVAFVLALNTWYGGWNNPGWPWYVPNRPARTRTDYLLLPLFALTFYWGVGYLLTRLGFSLSRAEGTESASARVEKSVPSRGRTKREKHKKRSKR